MSQKFKRRMASVMAGVIAVALLLSILLSLILPAAAARSSSDIASEIDDLNSQADDYANQADELHQQASAKQQEALDAVNKKIVIDQAVATLDQEISDIQAEIRQLNLDIAAKQAELDDAEDAEAEMTQRYKTRLRAMEENGEESYWSVIFHSSSLSDLLDRLAMIADVNEADRQMQQQLADARALVEQERQNLEQVRADRSAKQSQLAEKQEELAALREQTDQLILDLVSDNELLLAAEDAAAELEAQLRDEALALMADYKAAVRRENAAASQSASSSASSGTASASGFLYPLPSGAYVSCPYGYRIHPIRGDYTFHYGVDLAIGAGTPIYAAKSGTVVQSTMASVNGNYVTIQHSDGTSTLYAHMSSRAVSAGDYVAQGSVIGYVGTTGLSTGPHLHFEIYVNGSTVNPMEYVSVS